MTVITANSDEGPVGITANSFSSLSLDPALVLWSPAKGSRRFPYFEKADHFAIHVLAADQGDICEAFAKSAYAYQDYYGHKNQHNVPLIDNCLARFECEQSDVHDGGDHVIIVGRVVAATMLTGVPLVFSGGQYGGFRPGE